MTFNESQQTTDFENIDLDVDGEEIEYISSLEGSKTINAIIQRGDASNRTGVRAAGLNYMTGKSGAWKCELLISKGSAGIVKIVPGKDRVKFKIESSDTNPRVFTVGTSVQDYGAWRLGIIA